MNRRVNEEEEVDEEESEESKVTLKADDISALRNQPNLKWNHCKQFRLLRKGCVVSLQKLLA